MLTKRQFSIILLSIFPLLMFFMNSLGDAGENHKNEIESLIAQLVSPNMPPDVQQQRPVFFLEYPEEYDDEAQRTVFQAEEQLRRKGLEAFPYLIQHLHNKRYSYTYTVQQYHNATVGDACFFIIKSHFPPFRQTYLTRKGANDETYYYPDYFYSKFLHANGEYNIHMFEQWWQKRSRASMRDIQIEILEWHMLVEEGRGFLSIEEKIEILGALLQEVIQLSEK